LEAVEVGSGCDYSTCAGVCIDGICMGPEAIKEDSKDAGLDPLTEEEALWKRDFGIQLDRSAGSTRQDLHFELGSPGADAIREAGRVQVELDDPQPRPTLPTTMLSPKHQHLQSSFAEEEAKQVSGKVGRGERKQQEGEGGGGEEEAEDESTDEATQQQQQQEQEQTHEPTKGKQEQKHEPVEVERGVQDQDVAKQEQKNKRKDDAADADVVADVASTSATPAKQHHNDALTTSEEAKESTNNNNNNDVAVDAVVVAASSNPHEASKAPTLRLAAVGAAVFFAFLLMLWLMCRLNASATASAAESQKASLASSSFNSESTFCCFTRRTSGVVRISELQLFSADGIDERACDGSRRVVVHPGNSLVPTRTRAGVRMGSEGDGFYVSFADEITFRLKTTDGPCHIWVQNHDERPERRIAETTLSASDLLMMARDRQLYYKLELWSPDHKNSPSEELTLAFCLNEVSEDHLDKRLSRRPFHSSPPPLQP